MVRRRLRRQLQLGEAALQVACSTLPFLLKNRQCLYVRFEFNPVSNMAPSIPGPLRGMLWPVGNIIEMASLPAAPAKGFGISEDVPASSHFAGKPVADTLGDHLGVQLGTLPKLALAAALWWGMRNIISQQKATEFDSDYVKYVVIRDLVITWCVAGFWDTLMHSHSSPFFARMRGHKLNPIEPTTVGSRTQCIVARWQFAHDAFWSTCSTLISSVFELALFYHYAKSAASWVQPGATDSWYTHVPTIAWALTMPYWRLAHFYTVHRLMHKWFPSRAPGTGVIPDVGAFLYKHVHGLHHLSKNPTAWSGVSMHPVESSCYYSAMLIPLAVTTALSLPMVHPIVFLYTKLDLTIAALVGHDGVGYPGGASQGHWLHHALIDCNFGENYAPFDWLFGTWAKDEADFNAKGLGERKVAKKAA